MKKFEGKRTLRVPWGFWEYNIKVGILSRCVECLLKESEGKRTLRGPRG